MKRTHRNSYQLDTDRITYLLDKCFMSNRVFFCLKQGAAPVNYKRSVLPYCLFSLPPQLLFTKYQLRVISPYWACVPGMALSNPNPGAFRRFMCARNPTGLTLVALGFRFVKQEWKSRRAAAVLYMLSSISTVDLMAAHSTSTSFLSL